MLYFVLTVWTFIDSLKGAGRVSCSFYNSWAWFKAFPSKRSWGYSPVTQHYAAYIQILFFIPIDKTAKLYYDIGA